MKRSYVKPIAVIENLSVAKHVPGCAWDVKLLGTLEECGAVGDEEDFNQPSDIRIFNKDGVCNISVNDAEDIFGEAFCYTPSSEGWNIFNS